MQRITGINDDPGWGAGPVFEQKLYYRTPEEVVDDDDQLPSLATKLLQKVPLDEYKAEKLKQLPNYHNHHQSNYDEMEADEKYTSCKHLLQIATDKTSVDAAIKAYCDWHQAQKFVREDLIE